MLLHSAAAVEASFCYVQASISMRFVLVGGMLKQATWLMFGGLFSREWRRGLCLDSQPNKGVGLEKESNDQRRLTCVSGFVRWSGFVLAALYNVLFLSSSRVERAMLAEHGVENTRALAGGGSTGFGLSAFCVASPAVGKLACIRLGRRDTV